MSKRSWTMLLTSASVVLCGLLFGATLCCAKTTTTTAVTISNSTPKWFTEVTLTSTTTPSPVSGNVKFFEDNGVLLQEVALSGGTATWTQKFLGGSHKVYAIFEGNGNYTSSTSSRVAMTVTAALSVPTSGAYLGLIPGPSNNEVNIEATEGSAAGVGIDRQFPLHVQYRIGPVIFDQEVDADGNWHPDPNLQGDIDAGRVPVLSWPCDQMVFDSDAYIAGGSEDASVIKMAKALAQFPGPVMLRWSWELNDFDHANCHGDLTAGGTGGTGWQASDYTNFQLAWQHIWTVFQQNGATNVVFLWNLANYNQGQNNPPYDTSGDSFYPGDAFVDWVGLDAYQRNPNSNFTCNMKCFYKDFNAGKFGLDTKPLIMGESGTGQYSMCSEELQADYLTGSADSVESDYASDTQFKAYDLWDTGTTFPLDSHGGFAAFKTMAGTSGFGAGVVGGVNNTPFAISFSSQTVTGTPGGANLTTTVTVTPASWFTGTLDLSAGGLYHGMTASFSTSHISFASSQTPVNSTLTLTTSASTPPTPPVPSGLNLPANGSLGMTMITVTGTSGAGQQASNGLVMQLNGPTFTIATSSSDNSTAPIDPGGSEAPTITVTSVDGYSGMVNLQAMDVGAGSGLINGYNGVTASYSPASVTVSPGHPGTSTLTLSTTAPGTGTLGTLLATYHIVITGTDSSNSNVTQSIFQGEYNAPSYSLYVGGGPATTGHFNCTNACPDTTACN